MKSFRIFLTIFTVGCYILPGYAQWKPVEGHIMTRWAAEVNPVCPLPEYPRPQLVRSAWMNLNGLWDYAVTPIEQTSSAFDDGKILVPFAIESALSGVKRSFLPTEKLWYRRTFEIPAAWKDKRVLLHFGAVDYISTIRLNGKKVGTHEGGNVAFSFDITNFLTSGKPQELIVEVTDPSSEGKQPKGKQTLDPKGIWYTPVSGIWKTVWIEPVDDCHIVSHHGIPDVDNERFLIRTGTSDPDAEIRYSAFDEKKCVAQTTVASGEQAELKLPSPKLWSPDAPFLYGLRMEVVHNGRVTDIAESYFGMRKVSIGKDAEGKNRILLNDQPLFQYGFLDQGWWPDSLLTAPTEEALISDIDFTKKAGFNTIRKHIKVESERFYYHCDRSGILVWQDAVSGDDFNLKDYPDGIDKDARSAAQYELELQETIDQLRNYPCIVNWVVFNEGWGQFGGPRLIDWVKRYDPTRLAEVSGWVDMGNGDIDDVHRYPGPGRVANPGPHRAFAIGEFGGLGLPVEGHLWNPAMNNWGYATYTEPEKFAEAYRNAVFQLRVLIGQGLSAAIYTQTTDVEGEVNGMLTYDREIEKIPAEELRALHKRLYEEPLKVTAVVEDSQRVPQQWYYTMTRPGDDWFRREAPPADWQTGPAPFGYNHPDNQLSYSVYEKQDAAHRKNTEWKGPNLWMWREFDLREIPASPWIAPRYDEKMEIYINGVRVVDLSNRAVHYYHADLIPLPEEVRKTLRKGRNTIAVHVWRGNRPKRSQSCIADVGIVNIE